MAVRDIVVVGASAGGVSALLDLARELGGFPGSLLVVVHTSVESPGVLPSLLQSASGLEASFPRTGEFIRGGHIYVGKPDFHLLVKNRRLELAHGPKENGFRPAVDPLFRTAARCFGKRVVGVVLSGGLDDGTDGLRVIKMMGGVAIAQDPEEAIFPSMPTSAIRSGAVDQVARVKDIAQLLRRFATETVTEDMAMCADLDRRPDIAENGDKAIRNGARLGPPSVLTCPDCGGSLWEFMAGNQLRYRCHVGHLFTGDGLMESKDDHLEQALWAAVRAMEEASVLRLRMAEMAERGKWGKMAPPYRQQSQEFKHRADLIRELLLRGGTEKGNGKQIAARGREKSGKVPERTGSARRRVARKKARNPGE